MNVITRQTSFYTTAKNRRVTGIVIHHTATTAAVPCHSNGSWHWLIGRDGAVYRDVPEEHVAWHAASTDRWRPSWVVKGDGRTSDINACSIGIELAYAPQAPYSQTPTAQQEAALRELLADIYARRGPLHIVAHGEIALDKWPSEPHALDWVAIGCGLRTEAGRLLVLPPPAPGDTDMPLTPEQQSILDSAATQSAAGNTIANGGDLDWWLGTWHQLASDKESLAQLLAKSQGETHAQAVEVARLQSLLAAPGAAPAAEVEAVEVRLSGGKVAVLTR